MAIARSAGKDAVIVRVLNLLTIPLRVPPLLQQSLTRTEDALALAERLGDPVQLFYAPLVGPGEVAGEMGLLRIKQVLEGVHGDLSKKGGVSTKRVRSCSGRSDIKSIALTVIVFSGRRESCRQLSRRS